MQRGPGIQGNYCNGGVLGNTIPNCSRIRCQLWYSHRPILPSTEERARPHLPDRTEWASINCSRGSPRLHCLVLESRTARYLGRRTTGDRLSQSPTHGSPLPTFLPMECLHSHHSPMRRPTHPSHARLTPTEVCRCRGRSRIEGTRFRSSYRWRGIRYRECDSDGGGNAVESGEARD